MNRPFLAISLSGRQDITAVNRAATIGRLQKITGSVAHCTDRGFKNCTASLGKGHCKWRYGRALRVSAASDRVERVRDYWTLDETGDGCKRNGEFVGKIDPPPGETETGRRALCAYHYTQ